MASEQPEPHEPLFSYGLLQKRDTQRELFGRELIGAADALVGFTTEPIELTEPDGRTWTHYIAVRGADDDRIPGAVLMLTPGEIAACDNYEPEPYRRVSVRLASGQVAWAYVHCDKR